jgi:excisionase family DNA binding protein
VADAQRLLTTAELAEVLHVSRRTIVRWVTEGVLTPTFTMPGGAYRWDAAEVREQLRRRGQN